MTQQALIAGGGIGGLACALALARAGVHCVVLEQTAALGEVGAGLQLGPNAVRVLADWGLMDELQDVAAFPEALHVRDAHGGQQLGRLRLGAMPVARHGQVYATLHRADLQGLLLQAVQRFADQVSLQLGARLVSFDKHADGVSATLDRGNILQADALVGCDGLWSRVRAQLLGDGPPRATGHLAYRGMVRTADLPPALKANVVTAWLGPRLHVVHYPVKQGEWINVVAVVHGTLEAGDDPQGWTHEAHAAELKRTLGPAFPELLAMLEAVTGWQRWALNDRAPMQGPQDQAQGRVALLGDAAHPMRPYLAQGAAMALEDAWTLGRLAAAQRGKPDWPDVFAQYAQMRWARNAQVQARSQRNGTIFHASGPLRWGRNRAMALLGERLLDNAWLYDGPPEPPPATPEMPPLRKRKTT